MQYVSYTTFLRLHKPLLSPSPADLHRRQSTLPQSLSLQESDLWSISSTLFPVFSTTLNFKLPTFSKLDNLSLSLFASSLLGVCWTNKTLISIFLPSTSILPLFLFLFKLDFLQPFQELSFSFLLFRAFSFSSLSVSFSLYQEVASVSFLIFLSPMVSSALLYLFGANFLLSSFLLTPFRLLSIISLIWS